MHTLGLTAALYCIVLYCIVLHWIKGVNRYKQFVSNRATKIKEKDYIMWRNVPKESNPAEIANQRNDGKKLDGRWLRGPEWLVENRH